MINFAILAFQSESPDAVAIGCAAIVAVIVFALMIWSLIWVYNDAEARGKSGCLVALLVFLLSWPLSLLVWIVFRPEKR
jgi:hypothetical protein